MIYIDELMDKFPPNGKYLLKGLGITSEIFSTFVQNTAKTPPLFTFSKLTI